MNVGWGGLEGSPECSSGSEAACHPAKQGVGCLKGRDEEEEAVPYLTEA